MKRASIKISSMVQPFGPSLSPDLSRRSQRDETSDGASHSGAHDRGKALLAALRRSA